MSSNLTILKFNSKGVIIISTVFIDLGHGGKDSGAIGVGGRKEKDIVLQVGKLVELKLKRCGLNPVLSRQNDTFLSLDERTQKANKLKAKCLVSIHCNSANTKAMGVETFCYKFKYRELADCVHSEILKTKAYTKDRGVKEGNLHMVRESSMSACLVELGFIDNSQDIQILEKLQDDLATGIAKGICKYIKVPYIGGEVTGSPDYIVATGAFSNVENARIEVQKLKDKGFKNAYIHKCN